MTDCALPDTYTTIVLPSKDGIELGAATWQTWQGKTAHDMAQDNKERRGADEPRGDVSGGCCAGSVSVEVAGRPMFFRNRRN